MFVNSLLIKLNTFPLLIDFLNHIQQESAFIIEIISDYTADKFMSNPLRSRAITYCLLIVGEACKKVPDDFRLEHSEFDWCGFASLRDRLIHHY